MGITRVRAVRRHKKKELEKTLKLILFPPVAAGVLLFGTQKKKSNRSKRKWK